MAEPMKLVWVKAVINPAAFLASVHQFRISQTLEMERQLGLANGQLLTQVTHTLFLIFQQR
jgi:hypothetical protein